MQGPDGHGQWEVCEFINSQDHCHIWTVSGTSLADGVFVPHDDGAEVSSKTYELRNKAGLTSLSFENGRYLIPANGDSHAAAIRYLDFMTGKTKSFDSAKENDK